MRLAIFASLMLAFAPTGAGADEPFVPGSGVELSMVGDDFEDPQWGYIKNGAKASFEQDETQRPPGGRSRNGRWYESAMRGQPDVVRRIATPPGGLAGSKGAMLMVTRLSGIPGEISRQQMQDDLLMSVKERVGRPIPVAWQPSCVARVYLPEFDRWENRTGSSFGVRADVQGRNRDGEIEPYWPGFFILFRSKTSPRYADDFAEIRIRAGQDGRDVKGPKIIEPGWWTFGMSFTPDGQVHFYARPGVEDLTEDDYLYSSFPYGSKCLLFDNFFFNVANLENGKNWSTPWVIDDPAMYVIPPGGRSVQSLLRSSNSTARNPGRSSGGGLGGAFRNLFR